MMIVPVGDLWSPQPARWFQDRGSITINGVSLAQSRSRRFAPDVQSSQFERASLHRRACVLVQTLDYPGSLLPDQSATSRT